MHHRLLGGVAGKTQTEKLSIFSQLFFPSFSLCQNCKTYKVHLKEKRCLGETYLLVLLIIIIINYFILLSLSLLFLFPHFDNSPLLTLLSLFTTRPPLSTPFFPTTDPTPTISSSSHRTARAPLSASIYVSISLLLMNIFYIYKRKFFEIPCIFIGHLFFSLSIHFFLSLFQLYIYFIIIIIVIIVF